MKRIAAVVVAIVLAASAAAYGTTLSMQERPSNEPVQTGVLYQASFCNSPTTPVLDLGRGVTTFYMRVTRELNRGWIEVEYASWYDLLDPSSRVANPSIGDRQPSTARFNLNLLCMVKPVTP